MMHMGCHRRKQSDHQKNKENTWGDTTYRESVSEIFCQVKTLQEINP
jgi:hypothetical protein